jgi:REP element-mobilizing transposase RayT
MGSAALITSTIERALHRELANEACRHNCRLIALNGTEDHVHLLLEIPATVSISELVKGLKGVSSHFVNGMLNPEVKFKWQASYSAFTVTRWDLRKIANYIKGQKQHHAQDKTIAELEAIDTLPSATADD